MILRTAKPGDREQIIGLINRVAGERRYLQTACYQPTASWERLLRVGYDAKAGMALIVLTHRQEIIGIGRLFADSHHSHSCPIGNLGLVLTPAWRDMGLGTILLARLIDIARLLDYSCLRADILKGNQRSFELFQKFGFEITDIHRTYWSASEVWVDEMTVERRIKPLVYLPVKP
jgi:RimJ/RimL family protein N-acetyltransferase